MFELQQVPVHIEVEEAPAVPAALSFGGAVNKLIPKKKSLGSLMMGTILVRSDVGRVICRDNGNDRSSLVCGCA